MYLKSIEMHGFKSFANKIVLEFHDGITGIVGPNGSGKSNVADAVRWVLGEQSARQLRGASMQDVIFAGTQNRNPLSYAYVAITLDNSDHMLPIDFEEVTIARRVYRSGESEYLLNGSPCRLKDVNELFFDTGIGKEGYSIIGQGQIERILSGKPEERRELFDEAVGIVKYKKRKAASIKKLEEERENLVRVNDILAELERQVGPLEEQAQTAKLYLKRKEELKTYDVNMFLLEISRLNQLLDEINKNYRITDEQLQSQKEEDERIKVTYASLEEQLEAVDAQIDSLKDEESKTSIAKSQLENEIKLLEEQIRFAQSSEENTAKRKAEIESEKEAFEKEKEGYEQQNAELTELLNEAVERLNKAKEYFANLENEINACNEGIERDNREMLALINGRSEIKSKEQKYSTMTEQINIRKAQLNQRLLARKTEENQLQAEVEKAAAAYDEIRNKTEELEQNQKEIETKIHDSKDRIRQANIALQEAKDAYNKESSRLESLKNIAERYDGYGKSIRSVMEQKDKNSGIHGVIADLIHVQKKYEIAIETALGGNIQNIVTEDEETAKRMIDFLKKNHLGRATFLPITSVDGRGNFKKTEVLDDKGVIGLASELVDCDSQYEGVIAYLLGRVVVTKTVDDALALARKNKYSLHIVTLEGEYLSPGGSISGGAFRNNSNLLGRHREIDDMEKRLEELAAKQKEMDQDILGRQAAIALLEDDLDENRKALSAAAVERNTAEINLARSKELMKESENAFQSLNTEGADIEKQLAEIEKAQKDIAGELEASLTREQELKDEIAALNQTLDEKTYMETAANRNVAEVQIEEASARQKVDFVNDHISRVTASIEKSEAALAELLSQAANSKEEMEQRRNDIERIKDTISGADENFAALEAELKAAQAKKIELNDEYKSFFDKKEAISKAIADLEKEIFRLDAQREKTNDSINYQNSYMWDEYELTYHAAERLRDENYKDHDVLRKLVNSTKDALKKMGNVNVNAIEEYKEVSERYFFLKDQHDDLIEAEQRLVEIIDELDTGMRQQFTEGFANIQREFDKAFKELFGGGKGELALVEGEDILETGIKIIAQPPGKKLQNMMQLSGGEKSLTAIALLFAIQNLKPSPFCLLDEIEAALDDSNVDRYAKYLHKLTKNTQFIVITHRRGTMNAADRLYGITMQEKGISTLVSVNLIEADLDE